MLLSREGLKAALKSEGALTSRLIVTPLLDPAQVGDGSIDLRLGTEFLLLRRTKGPHVSPRTALTAFQANQELYQREVVPLGGSIWLHPRQLVLGATLEYVQMPLNLGAYVLGRSSWGRWGLVVATAVMVHPGFRGMLTLELVNEGDSPIELIPGVRIAQLAVHEMADVTTGRGPDSKYWAPTGPEPPLLSRETGEIDRLRATRDALDQRSDHPPDETNGD